MALGYGFLAKNGNAEVLIDSRAKNLFFLNKANYISSISTESYCGGNIVLKYEITSPKVPIPFFTIPDTSRYVGLIRIVNTRTNIFQIELLVSSNSTNNIPEVYVFIEHDKILSPYGSYGLVVYKQGTSSEVTFDSRLKPLLIKNTTSIAPSASPYTRTDAQMATAASANGSNLGYLESPGGSAINNADTIFGKLIPDNTRSYNIIDISLTKPIFNYSSIGQAYKKYYLRDSIQYDTYSDLDVGHWYPNHTTIIYWNNFATFSRPGIKYSTIGTNLTITVGWIVVKAAQYNDSTSGEAHTTKTFAPNTTYAGIGSSYGSFLESQSLNIRASPITIADASNFE